MPTDGQASEKPCTVAVNTLLCGLPQNLCTCTSGEPWNFVGINISVITFRSKNGLADTRLQRCTFVVDEQKVLGGCYLSRCKAEAYLRQQLVAHLLLLPFSRLIES